MFDLPMCCNYVSGVARQLTRLASWLFDFVCWLGWFSLFGGWLAVLFLMFGWLAGWLVGWVAGWGCHHLRCPHVLTPGVVSSCQQLFCEVCV